MPIPQETIDELKRVARIEDVVIEFLTVQTKGNRLKANCPKCNGKEKINVHKGKNIATCFKCDQTGKQSTYDPIRFLMDPDYGNLSYPEALKWLGNFYNIIVEEEPVMEAPKVAPVKKKPAPQQPKDKGPLKSTRPKPQERKGKLSFRDEQLRASGIDDDDQMWELPQDGNTKTVIPRYLEGTLDYSKNFEVGPGVDMVMRYSDLDGHPMMYVPKGRSTKPRPLVRVRYKHPEQHPDKHGRPTKYKSPPGSTSALWIPERIKSLYASGAQYDTLGVQEGEKKSDRACKAGVYSVGAMGIHNIAADDRPMPQEFERIIDRNGIKNVIFFMDSDLFDLGKGTDRGIDFRPKLFFKAVERFQRYFQKFRNSGLMLHIFWAWVKPNDAGAKGTDDLLQSGLCTDEEYNEDVVNGISGKETRFIQMVDITSMSALKLKQYWHLHDPKAFAAHYKKSIQDMGLEVFRIGKIVYRWNEHGDIEMAQPFLPEEKFWLEESQKNGHPKIHFDYKGCYTFLTNRGYGRYRLPNREHTYIHIDEGVISETSPDDITDYMLEFLETHEGGNRRLLNAFYASNDTWMGQKGLKRLWHKNPIMMKDGYRVQHLFFKKQIWRVTQEGIQPLDIGNMGGNVWEEKIIDYNANLHQTPMLKMEKVTEDLVAEMEDPEEAKFYAGHIGEWILEANEEAKQCEFYQFLFHTSNFYWKKQLANEEDPKNNAPLTLAEEHENTQHLLAKLTAIGHMLHSYRTAHNEYAIVAMEGDMVEGGRSEGRTGKTLISKALREMVSVEEINGKKERITQDQFLFGNVTERTQVVVIDDVQKQFDLEFLFPYITGPFFVRAMQKQQFTIPYEDSPKLFVTTNFALKERGGSFVDRRRIIAFSNFFSSERKPQEFFGHLFFDDWEGDQWNKFYNLMALCLQLYFQAGTVVQAPEQRMEKRRLRMEIGETFIEWAEDFYGDEKNLNCKKEKDHLIIQFQEAFPRAKSWIDKRNFKKKLWQYALYKDYLVNPGKPYGVKENGKLNPTKGSMKEFYNRQYGGDYKTQGTEYVEMYTIEGWRARNAGTDIEEDLPF